MELSDEGEAEAMKESAGGLLTAMFRGGSLHSEAGTSLLACASKKALSISLGFPFTAMDCWVLSLPG